MPRPDTTDGRTPTYRFHGKVKPSADTRTPLRAEVPQVVEGDGVATLRLYDPVDSWGEFWGVSAKEFAATLDDLGPVTEIRLHINSPGGEVYEGIAILNLLRSHPARVVAVVDGIAASIASVIAVGADELIMGANSELMIHDAWGICVGDARDMRDIAGRLDALSDNLASVYAEKAGGDVAAWRDAMLAETWYSAREAVDAGLADSVTGDTTDGASPDGEIVPRNDVDLSMFNHQGRADAPAPVMPATQTVDATAPTFPQRAEVRRRMHDLRRPA